MVWRKVYICETASLTAMQMKEVMRPIRMIRKGVWMRRQKREKMLGGGGFLWGAEGAVEEDALRPIVRCVRRDCRSVAEDECENKSTWVSYHSVSDSLRRVLERLREPMRELAERTAAHFEVGSGGLLACLEEAGGWGEEWGVEKGVEWAGGAGGGGERLEEESDVAPYDGGGGMDEVDKYGAGGE